MNRILTSAALAALVLAPLSAAGQDEAPADPVPPRSYTVEDDFYFTQALFCAIERCGFSSYREASAYAEVGWNDLRASGVPADELHRAACGTSAPCGEDAFTATLVRAPGARTDLVVDPVPPPPPVVEEEYVEIEEIEEELEVEEASPGYTQARRSKAFIRPNLQAGLGGGLWVLPTPSDTGRLLMPRVLAGGMLDVVVARAVASFGIGFDEEYQFYRAMHLGFQAGPMFGDGDSRIYVAGTFGASWLQVDYGLIRGQYGGIEAGAYVLTNSKLGMFGWFIGTEIHGTAMNTFIEFPDGTVIHGGRPHGINLYAGVQFGF